MTGYCVLRDPRRTRLASSKADEDVGCLTLAQVTDFGCHLTATLLAGVRSIFPAISVRLETPTPTLLYAQQPASTGQASRNYGLERDRDRMAAIFADLGLVASRF